MILADKIIQMRRKNGWSQEELADKMNVSRQAVSKWESAQTVPELEKILQLSRLFGVTTDYLLKDEIQQEEASAGAEDAAVRHIDLAFAQEYLEWRKKASVIIAAGALLCIIAPIPLILAGAQAPVSESLPLVSQLVLGLVALLLIVAAAVSLFAYCGFQNHPYEFIDTEPFETGYGVRGMVSERKAAYRGIYVACNIAGIILCILSPLPLFLGLLQHDGTSIVQMVPFTMLLVGAGVVLFIVCGVRWASMGKLLQEADYVPDKTDVKPLQEVVGTVYWMLTTAIYLLWSFLGDAWSFTWLIWPVAGVLYAAINAVLEFWVKRKKQ